MDLAYWYIVGLYCRKLINSNTSRVFRGWTSIFLGNFEWYVIGILWHIMYCMAMDQSLCFTISEGNESANTSWCSPGFGLRLSWIESWLKPEILSVFHGVFCDFLHNQNVKKHDAAPWCVECSWHEWFAVTATICDPWSTSWVLQFWSAFEKCVLKHAFDQSNRQESFPPLPNMFPYVSWKIRLPATCEPIFSPILHIPYFFRPFKMTSGPFLFTARLWGGHGLQQHRLGGLSWDGHCHL